MEDRIEALRGLLEGVVVAGVIDVGRDLGYELSGQDRKRHCVSGDAEEGVRWEFEDKELKIKDS
jgi:hypothetical protein